MSSLGLAEGKLAYRVRDTRGREASFLVLKVLFRRHSWFEDCCRKGSGKGFGGLDLLYVCIYGCLE